MPAVSTHSELKTAGIACLYTLGHRTHNLSRLAALPLHCGFISISFAGCNPQPRVIGCCPLCSL